MSVLDPFDDSLQPPAPLESPTPWLGPPTGAGGLPGSGNPLPFEEDPPDFEDDDAFPFHLMLQEEGLFPLNSMTDEESMTDGELPLSDSDSFVPPGSGDAYAIEARAETINVLAVGDSVRRGDLDMVQIGSASVTDMVTGSETANISGKLREHTGRGMTYTAARAETTVEGRMSITSGTEDAILLGGTMIDTWIGGTLTVAAMSDDLCVGAGVRATGPVDLWLNQLTGMEERPATATSDGVFFELCGTLFEREYGASIHAASTAVFVGTTYQTQRTGFRALMRVAMGVRDLMPAASAASAEPPPPGPSGAEGALVAGTMVMAGAGVARGVTNTVMAVDDMTTMFRAGDAAMEVENVTDLRRAADTASQIQDLSKSADFVDSRLSNVNWVDNDLYAGVHASDSASQLQDLSQGTDFIAPASPGSVNWVSDDPYAVVHASDSLIDNPNAEANIAEVIDGGPPPALPTGQGQVGIGSSRPLPPPPSQVAEFAQEVEEAKSEVLRSLFVYEWQLRDELQDFRWAMEDGDAVDQARFEAVQDAWTAVHSADNAIKGGEDPTKVLTQYATHLDELGFPDEAEKLRDFAEEYQEFLTAMRALTPDGELPPGILYSAGAVSNPQDWPVYDLYGAPGTGSPLGAPAKLEPPADFGEVQEISHLQPESGGELGEKLTMTMSMSMEAGGVNPPPLSLDTLDTSDPVHGVVNGDILKKLKEADEALASGDTARHAQLMAEVDSLNSLRVSMIEDPEFTAGNAITDAAMMDDAADPRIAEMMEEADRMEDGVQAEALREAARRLQVQETDVFADSGGMDEVWNAEIARLYQEANELQFAGPQGAERAEALREVAGALEQANLDIARGVDPRQGLMASAARLDEYGFAEDAMMLRVAAGEYSQMLDGYRLAEVEDGSFAIRADTFDSFFDPPPADIEELLMPSHHLEPMAGNPSPFASLEPEGLPPAYLDVVNDVDELPLYSDLVNSADEVDVSGLRLHDVEGDDVRNLVDIEPEQMANFGEDAASLGEDMASLGYMAPIELPPPSYSDLQDSERGAEGIGAAAQPQLDDTGARWGVESGPRPFDPDTGRPLTEGDYAEIPLVHQVEDAASVGHAPVQAVPPDTLAVVDAMPDLRLGGAGFVDASGNLHDSTSFDLVINSLDRNYEKLRRASNWRGALEYETVIKEMRADVLRMLVSYGGYSEDAANATGSLSEAYRALWNALEAAEQAGDTESARHIEDFLADFHFQAQDSLADLANRVDGVDTTLAPLDPHIDQGKLHQWLADQQEAAMQNMLNSADDPEAMKRFSNEMTYYQQMVTCLDEGRNPLIDSGDQIAYLQFAGQLDQADEYLTYQMKMTDVLSDPEFHHPPGQMGDSTFGPSVLSMSSSEIDALQTPGMPGVVDNADTSVFRPQVEGLGNEAAQGEDGAQLVSGDYGANRDIINAEVGEVDYVHVPEEQPEGLSAPTDALNPNADVQSEFRQHVDDLVRTAGDEAETAYWRANPEGSASEAFAARREAMRNARIDAVNSAWNASPTAMEDLRQSETAPRPRFSNDVPPKHVAFSDSRRINAPYEGWQASQFRPGFGRTTETLGEFPFSMRENLLNSLMKGDSLRGTTDLAALNAEFARARSANFVSQSKRDWRKMAMLLRNLQATQPGDAARLARMDAAQNARFLDSLVAGGYASSGFDAVSTAAFLSASQSAQTSAFVQSLDWKSLGKLLSIFEAGVSVT